MIIPGSVNAVITALSVSEAVSRVEQGVLVDGRWRPRAGGATFAVEDPATGQSLCEVAEGTPDGAVAALAAADKTQAGWAAVAPRRRGEILRRA